MKHIFLMLSLVFFSLSVSAKTKEVEVPRSAYQDTYKYYVVEESKSTTNMRLTYKRVGATAFDYGIIEANCPSKVMRLLGTGLNVKGISTANPSQWVQPRIGTIEYDMMSYVCR